MNNLIQFPAAGRNQQSSRRPTPREIEVLELAIHTNREIGKILCISPKTVKAHLRSVFVKLGAETRTQALMIHNETATQKAA